MVPHHIDWHDGALPRNANGKIDRKELAGARVSLFAQEA
jgi:acyl-coenzyme A synthetase/AMP-(fatty) acid ligase